jgi:DNA-binding GntR family transcriptional regulator
MGYGKAKHLTVTEKIYAELKAAILNEKHLPGEHLVETDIVTEYKCSRATIREALRYLVDDGLVELIPHKGIIVRRLTKKQIIDICKVLYHLQPLLGHLAIQECDDEKYKILENKVSETVISDYNYKVYFRTIADFFLGLSEITGNLMLIREMRYIYMLLKVNYRMINFDLKEYYLTLCRHEILAALKDKDEGLAVKLMSDFVNDIISSVEKHY